MFHTNEEWTERILGRRTCVSDTVAFTASSAPESCIDPDHGMIYSTYLASRQNYGESRNIVALARIPVCQPERFTTWIVAESGMEVAGKKYGEFLDCNAYYYQTSEEAATVVTHFGQTGTLYRGYVRVLFLSYGEEYYYTDFDIQNETFSEIRPLKVLFSGEEKPLTGALYAEILRDFGFTDFDLYKEKWEHVILTDKFRLYTDGFRYSMMTAGQAQPVCVRIAEGSDVLEIRGAIPKLGQYETQSAILNCHSAPGAPSQVPGMSQGNPSESPSIALGSTKDSSAVMAALVRGAEGDNYYLSDDLGLSWRPAGRVEFNTTRPQLLPYKGKLLRGISIVGVLPNRVRDGRNNLILSVAARPELDAYEDIFFIQDPYGIVYYDIFDYKDTLYMLWSSGDLYIDKNPQAKDLLWFARIGDLPL
ncbi:MAG: hypothetical protein IKG97_08130 [Lachnospiraceae bacterium]|nr:hypothetical protein [Lachnospiraceae bacterium]